jgi:tetratricopeptide (TPR) repeat protein
MGCGGGQREAEREPSEGEQGSVYEQAEAAFMAGNDDEASALLAEIPEDAPETARAHNLRGLIHARRGNTALATLEFKEALRIDPKLSQAHNNLGALYLQDGRLDLATASLESAVAEDPYYLAAHKSLAEAYYKSGQMDKAQEELELIKELESAQSASVSGSLQDLQIGQPLDVAELIQQEEAKKEEERQAEARRAAAKKAAAEKAAAAARRPTTKTVTRQVSAPAGTVLSLSLAQPLSSGTAQLNQPVSAHVVGDVFIGQDLLIRSGAAVKGLP